MKKLSFIIFVAVALLLASNIMAAKVQNVELSYKDGFTIAKIDVEGTVRFSHQTVVAKDGKPFRVIVDVLSATHDLGSKDFTNLPLCPVKNIRSSQFSVTPEQVVRIVFDMDSERIYRIDSDKNSVILTFSDKGTKPFKVWASNSFVKSKKSASKAVPQPKKKKPVLASKEKSKSASDLNKSIKKDRMLSLESSTPTPVKKVTRKVVASKPKAVTKKVVAKVTKPAPVKKTSVITKTFSEKPTPAKVTKPAPVKKVTKTVVASKPKATPKKVVAKVTKPSPVKKVTKTVVASKPKAAPKKAVAKVTKPSPVKKVTKTVVASKPKAAPKKAVAKVTKPSPVKKVTKTVVASKPKAAPKKAVAKITKPASVKKTTKKIVASKPKIKKKKVASKNKSTSRFRRSPANSKKIRGTLVAQFPKRLVIKYKAKKYRDPFETLINESKTYNDPIKKRVPNVEGLRLVGIIESEDNGNRALFEDNTGYGYILRTGDKVRKGYVLRVDDSRVYFQIFEYGWSRTVSLSLES